MKKYRITYIANTNVIDRNPNINPEKYEADEYVSGDMTDTKSIELFAYSADHAEYKFYKSFGGSSTGLIKILDISEIPVDKNDMNTYRVYIYYTYDDLEKAGCGDIVVSAVSPQQAELFVLRALCNTDNCGIHAHAKLIKEGKNEKV